MTSTIITPEEVRPHDLVRAVSDPVRLSDWPAGTALQGAGYHFELLHRPNPKPPVGTVLSGRQVKSRAWKRGTKFCYVKRGTLSEAQRRDYEQTTPLYTIVFLTPDGQFAYKTTSADRQIMITDDSEFILVYRPTEESEITARTVNVELTGAQVRAQEWPEGTRLYCFTDATPYLGGNNVGDVFTLRGNRWEFNGGGDWYFYDDDRFVLLDNLD